MRPGSRYLKDMAIQHLHGCPITSRDVTIADNVYGPNLGSLKGKTTRRPVPSVSNMNDPEANTYKHMRNIQTTCENAICLGYPPRKPTWTRPEYAPKNGVEIGDDLDDIVDDPNDEDFTPLDPETADDTLFYDDNLSAAELEHPEFPYDPSFTDLYSVSSHDDDSIVSDPETTGVRMETDNDSCDGDNYVDEDSDNLSNTENTGLHKSTGVEDTRPSENTGVGDIRFIEDTGVEDTRSIDCKSSGVDDKPSNMYEEIRSAKEARRIASINDEQSPKRMQKTIQRTHEHDEHGS
ncbi:hypothetical protein IV203_034639 [Nitzschia inconspicua]|uniref:Uncharacterized protein n=1 Tax=Nitzschia inconspicua TaxID=303405 RepID=A0A9K3LER0_9STRA|nr:hypothetical protein IV203_002725 [Nitzschia inconspicua]KAG7359541.1 hypothetical protein IV203_034639 [Nitzschia inconspicua]